MIELRRISPNIGAEVLGVDLRGVDDASFKVIYHAFLDHIVVVIRGQQLTMEEYLYYSARFGELKAHIVKKHNHPDFPELQLMDNGVEDKKKARDDSANPVLVKRGAVWHTDLSYEPVTAKATQLYALSIPSRGGDTLFANSYRMYETLPAPLKQSIEGLCGTYRYGGRLRRGVELLEEVDRNRELVVHPLVRIHPETGRKTLYFDGGKIIDIVGVERAKSEALIAQLVAHTNSPEGDYRHQWQVGDVIIWDNRCSLHAATGDAPANERRAFWRVTIMEEDWQQRQRHSA